MRENNILLTTAKCSNEKCDFKGIREMAFKKRMQAKSDKPVGDGWWFRCTASKCTTWKSCRVNCFFDMFTYTAHKRLNSNDNFFLITFTINKYRFDTFFFKYFVFHLISFK
jgi:hypothetical protein